MGLPAMKEVYTQTEETWTSVQTGCEMRMMSKDAHGTGIATSVFLNASIF